MAQYDPTKVKIVVDGHVVTGFGEDTMINVSRMEDKRDIHVGAQGETTFMKSANDAAEVTITLASNSPSNVKFRELYAQDEPFVFVVVDQNFAADVGGLGSECVVQNLPDWERGNELGEREWVFIVADYEEAFEDAEGVI